MSNTEMASCGKSALFILSNVENYGARAKNSPGYSGAVAGSSWLLHIKQMYVKKSEKSGYDVWG
jgi:hypothetical protein